MDTKEAKLILENNPTWNKFINDYWLDFEEYAKVQDFHPDIIALNHNSVRRIAYIVLQGELEAYTVTKQDAKLVPVYTFQAGMTIGDVVAIFSHPWTFGLRTLSSTHLLAIDLDLIEHTTQNLEMYEDLFEIIYSELGFLTADINNNRIENNLNVREILPGNLFNSILDDISDKDYEIIKNNLKFVFYNANEIIISEGTKVVDMIFIETGKLTKTIYETNKVIDCEDSVGELEVFEDADCPFELLSATKSLVLKFGIKNVLNSSSEKLKNLIYNFLIKRSDEELDDIKKTLSVVSQESELYQIRTKRISILSIKMLIVLAFMQLFFSGVDTVQILEPHRPILHSIIIFCSVLVVSLILRESHINISSFGFTFQHKKAFAELGIVIVILIFISIAWNDMLMTYAKGSLVDAILYPAYLDKKHLYNTMYWYYLLVSVIYIAIYEIILRGVWQTWFDSLFSGSYWVRAWKSIIAVNIISTMFYHSLFYEFYLIMFFASLCFGYIYAKYRNLYAVILGHIIYEIIIVTEVGLVVF